MCIENNISQIDGVLKSLYLSNNDIEKLNTSKTICLLMIKNFKRMIMATSGCIE